jgi:hypothetical protein
MQQAIQGSSKSAIDSVAHTVAPEHKGLKNRVALISFHAGVMDTAMHRSKGSTVCLPLRPAERMN